MFSAIGLFKGIYCPRGVDCTLPNCFYNHDTHNKRNPKDEAVKMDEYDPMSAGSTEEPPTKKRRIDLGEFVKQSQQSQEVGKAPVVQSSTPSGAKATPSLKSPTMSESMRTPSVTPVSGRVTTPAAAAKTPRATPTATVLPVSTSSKTAYRPLSSGPPTSVTTTPVSKTRQPVPPAPPEKLLPRNVLKAPVQFKQRLTYIELLHKLAQGHNLTVAKDLSNDRSLILTAAELIKLVLDDEEEAASVEDAQLYRNAMSQHYMRYKNFKIDKWKALVIEKFRATKKDESANTTEKTTPSGLQPVEEIELLRGVKTAVSGLEAYGYVTSPPTAAQIQEAENVTIISQGMELCDRCGTRFQVFPGRDAQGNLTTQGACYYHWGRIVKTQTHRDGRIYGYEEPLYPCCNKPAGSEGCTKGDCHVFKVTDPKRLASLLQFEKTPDGQGERRTPVAFDCEMAYTTNGLELVRVTAISWPDQKELLDVLVRPYGVILDLNTRFSGVSLEQYTSALPYDDNAATEVQDQEKEGHQRMLQKVESPAAARKLLFNLITPDTPLIGHAIENDLNACRIIHPFIIDTVLLYPHPKGLPAKMGLKALTAKYLHRNIQSAGAEGHDSKEDSIATGDLVRLKVGEKWKTMKAAGWKFEAGRLVAPKSN